VEFGSAGKLISSGLRSLIVELRGLNEYPARVREIERSSVPWNESIWPYFEAEKRTGPESYFLDLPINC
jgi:hypothetical protein